MNTEIFQPDRIGAEYNSIDEIPSFLMDNGHIQYTFLN